MRSLFTLFALTASTLAGATLVTKDAWLRLMPPGVKMTAGYVELQNTGQTPLVITDVKCPDLGECMIHETVQDEAGATTMHHVERLEIAPGKIVRLMPGGVHLMVMGLKRPIDKDTEQTIIFCEEARRCWPVRFRVRTIAPH